MNLTLLALVFVFRCYGNAKADRKINLIFMLYLRGFQEKVKDYVWQTYIALFLTLCKMSLIIVLTTLCSSRLFRDGRASPGPAAVHWQAGALQFAAWGERGQSVVWDCKATLWTGGVLRVILRLLVSWYLQQSPCWWGCSRQRLGLEKRKN